MKGVFGCFLNEDERNSQYESHFGECLVARSNSNRLLRIPVKYLTVELF